MSSRSTKRFGKPGGECLKCGAEMRRGVGPIPGVRDGERFVVTVPIVRCPRCGYKTVDARDLDEYSTTVADAFRRKHGRLTSREIRESRARLRMSQREFAEYIGVGIASVKRWESGMVQDRAMDELLRLKTQPEYAADNSDRLIARLGRPGRTG